MCQLMFTGRLRTQAGSQDFIILCSYSGARIQKYNISFCVNSCFIHEQFPHRFILQPEKQSEGEWKRSVHKLQRCDFLETASQLVLLFVFHLGCSFSFMDLNHPCIWIYENSASQRMQKESAVLFQGAGGGAPLETLLNSFPLTP